MESRDTVAHLVDFVVDGADFGSSWSIWQDWETLPENCLVQITENHFQNTFTVIRFVSTLHRTCLKQSHRAITFKEKSEAVFAFQTYLQATQGRESLST